MASDNKRCISVRPVGGSWSEQRPEGTQSVSADRMAEIRERIGQGFYDRRTVAQRTAQRLMASEDLGAVLLRRSS